MTGPIIRSRRVPRTLLLAAFALPYSACDAPGTLAPDAPLDVRPYVAGAAAANLGGDHLFAYPVPTAPASEPIIPPERARELAQSFALSYGPALEHKWNQEHGRSFDFRELRPDPRVFYQASTFELFPDGYHGAMRRAFGPYYLVRLSSGGRIRMNVAVSAYNTNVAVFSDGKLDRPFQSGADFYGNGAPIDTLRRDVVSPLSPEAAVAHVFRLAGVRVSEVPESVQIGWRWGPLGGGWKVTLERPITVRTLSGTRRTETRELYLGREGGRKLFIPAVEQPTVYDVPGIVPDSDDFGIVKLPVLPGHPTVFEEVAVVSADLR